jgi:hypothetical protein
MSGVHRWNAARVVVNVAEVVMYCTCMDVQYMYIRK